MLCHANAFHFSSCVQPESRKNQQHRKSVLCYYVQIPSFKNDLAVVCKTETIIMLKLYKRITMQTMLVENTFVQMCVHDEIKECT